MRKFVLAAALVLMAGGAQAVTLNVIGGILHGASGVNVGGSFYDVEFVDGTCFDVFNGCDDLTDFTFQTEASAVLAAQALLDQVFLDGPEGSFRSNPALTNGCDNSTYCSVVSPHRLSIFYTYPPLARPVELSSGNGAIGPLTQYGRNSDFHLNSLATFAVWQSSVVPEPNTALLLGLGLVGMAARRRV